MTEFTGLGSKVNAIKVNDGMTKSLKVSRKALWKKKIILDDYKECLFHKKEKNAHMNFIRSYIHTIFSITTNKRALSPLDGKRYVLEDGVHTLPYGHYAIDSDLNAA